MTEKDKLYADKLKERALSDYERLDRAINELEQQSSYNSIKTELKSCEDCVSRDEIIAWRELPQPYTESEVEDAVSD